MGRVNTRYPPEDVTTPNPNVDGAREQSQHTKRDGVASTSPKPESCGASMFLFGGQGVSRCQWVRLIPLMTRPRCVESTGTTVPRDGENGMNGHVRGFEGACLTEDNAAPRPCQLGEGDTTSGGSEDTR